MMSMIVIVVPEFLKIDADCTRFSFSHSLLTQLLLLLLQRTFTRPIRLSPFVLHALHVGLALQCVLTHNHDSLAVFCV